MKKQLFILIVAIMAIGLSSTVLGQVTCPVPRAVDVACLPNDALHPMAGTPYNYVVDVPTPPGTKAYTWFVTQDKNFMAGGILTTNRELAPWPSLHVAATGAGYNDPATGTNTLSITWNSFVPDPALPVFVVIHVQNTASTPDGCVTNNLKVFKILPINAFTLDIANVRLDETVAAYETSIDRCISNVVTATYDPTAPEGVLYDFGIDYLYFTVTAANFSTSWRPSLQIDAINAEETVTAVEWTRPNDFAFATPHAMPLAGTTYTSTDPVPVLAASGTVGAAGECIIIRITVDHTVPPLNYEGLADETITVAVDGLTQLAATPPIGDVHFSSTVPISNTNCGLVDGFLYDKSTQVLKPRPDITAPAMPAPGLLPVKP